MESKMTDDTAALKKLEELRAVFLTKEIYINLLNTTVAARTYIGLMNEICPYRVAEKRDHIFNCCRLLLTCIDHALESYQKLPEKYRSSSSESPALYEIGSLLEEAIKQEDKVKQFAQAYIHPEDEKGKADQASLSVLDSILTPKNKEGLDRELNRIDEYLFQAGQRISALYQLCQVSQNGIGVTALMMREIDTLKK